jgi:hypothetical protein
VDCRQQHGLPGTRLISGNLRDSAQLLPRLAYLSCEEPNSEQF